MTNTTPKRVRELVTYDQETGKVFWRPRTAADYSGPAAASSAKRFNTFRAGKAINHHGGPTVVLDGRAYPVSHIVWAVAFGRWPDNIIDHIDGDRSNNRLGNLRDVPLADNARNCCIGRANTSGRVGVRWNGRDGAWRARIGNDYIGNFGTFAEACIARAAAEASRGFHPNHGRQPVLRGADA